MPYRYWTDWEADGPVVESDLSIRISIGANADHLFRFSLEVGQFAIQSPYLFASLEEAKQASIKLLNEVLQMVRKASE